MRERYRSVVLLLCFLISIGLRTKVSAAENEDIELQDSNSCSFFCFLLAKEDDTISRHVDAAKNLNCTHVVYGYALIDQHQNLHDPNVNDFPMAATWGNYRYLQTLQQQQRPAKLFLAIREKERINFIDSSYARAKVINNIIQKAVFHYFDGIFLNLRSTSLLSFHYENFIRELRTELNVRATATSQKPLQLVVAVNAQNVFEAHRKLGTFAHMIDQLYLKSDEIISAVDENTAVLVEPLYGDTHTQLLDTISETAESIIAAGVPAEQIVIGLSSWARGYNLASNLTVNGAPVYDFVQMDDSMRSDGRFALQEICELANSTQLIHHDKSGAVSFVLNETQFFSYNPPQHESVARKIRWISSHGYGGIGVMQLEADDPTNHCGLGKYPLATAIAKQFKCSKRQHDQEKTTSCNRVCIYRPNVDHISYERLMPNWCSHIVVSSIEFKGDGSISETNEFKGAIVEYAKWSVTRKPFLILSIGAEMYWNHWNSLITNSSARHVFVQNARQIYVDSNAHGLELSLLDPIEVSEEIAQKVQTEFSNLLDELRKEMPKNALIFVTVTPFLTFANAYNVDMLNRNTDFIILEGHRFHHSPAFTGHHSPLFSDSKLLANSNMSIESMANAWSSYPNDRILVGFSSLGTRMSLPVGTTHQQQERSDDDSFLGLSTETSRTDRSTGSGVITQTELCEELVGSSTIHQYIAELGIPVAKKDNEFFAYDDVRSIQTKTIWSSMNGFGGVAFHAIEADNANGKCPSGQPFSLLRKIADTQTCQQCVQSKTEEQSKCDPDPFSVICSYRLPDEKDQQPMLPATIPFENCSEVVVEDLLWSADGHLRFRDQKSRDQLIALTELRETNQLAKQTRLIAAVKCGMLPKKMEEMLSSNRNLTASILEHLHRYNFDGVELRCDHTLTEKTRKSFLHFNLLLIEQLKGYHHHDACAATLSIRIPVSNNNLTEKYDIQLLNSVRHVVLEPFEINPQHAKLISPLFGLDKSNESHAIDSTVNNWIDSGVQAKKIIVHIPSYGIVQNFSTTVKAFGAGVQSNYTMIAQRDICTLLRRPNVHQHTFYDMIAAYATTPENQWITYETPSILRYKVNYAIREHLGGVGLVPLNRDDFQNNCGNGAFPLLNTIKQSICTV
ncbi:Chitinase-like protein C25A8.4 [Aphelenchoides besseyi]|nr:Chitinase-like protein C25A8.4 [Aphelenchoides besseyi]